MVNRSNYLVSKIKVLIRDNKILSKIYFFIGFFFKFNKIYYNTEYYIKDNVSHNLSNKFIRNIFAPIINQYIKRIHNIKLRRLKKTRQINIQNQTKAKEERERFELKNKSVSVLDVGCGNGRLFKYLDNKKADLIGIDPLDQISEKFIYNNKFFKCDINSIKGKFDLIIFFGSFRIIYKQHKFRIFKILKNLSNKDTVIICFNAGYVDLNNHNMTIKLIKDSILNKNKFTVFKML